MSKIKILYILPSLRLCNGVATYAMNYFRNIDKERFQIDFVIGLNEKNEYYDEIICAGSNIFYIPKLNIINMVATLKEIDNLLKNNDYDIVHCHVINMGAFYLYFAKKYGVKHRILHSHSTKYADRRINSIRNYILSFISKKYANHYFSCSKLAGDFLFKNKKYDIINNAITVEKFDYNEEIRKKVREKYNISDNQLVIGHVGRFCNQKNHKFLIELFKLVQEENNNSVLLLIGEGTLQPKIKEKVSRENIQNVIFTNNVSNVNEYMQAMDCFLLPSIYEGLPLVGIEAQTSGLPCIISDKVTKETDITGNCIFLPITNSSNNLWKRALANIDIKNRKSVKEKIVKSGYDISEETKKLEKYYLDIVEVKK